MPSGEKGHFSSDNWGNAATKLLVGMVKNLDKRDDVDEIWDSLLLVAREHVRDAGSSESEVVILDEQEDFSSAKFAF